MSHLQKILFWTILFISLSVRVSLANKVTGIDVDKFLKKVLTSQNFDDIVDKIAAKAAEKITHLKIKISENSLVGSTVNKREPTYRVSENVLKNNETINLQTKRHKFKRQSSSIRPLFIQYTVTEKDTSIDKEDSAPVDGLVLRYKHFTKQNHNRTQTFEKQNRKDQENPKKLQENASDAIKEAYEYIFTSSEIANETTGLVMEEVANTHNATFKSRNNEENELSEAKAESDEPDSLNVEFEKNYKAYVEYKKQPKKVDSHTKNISIETQDSPSLEEAAGNLSQSSVEETTTAITITHTLNSEGSESQEIEHDETTRTPVRKEGDKFFTFEKSPDYKDYHQKLSLVQKGIEE